MADVVQTIHAYTVYLDSKIDLNLNIACLQWHLVDLDYELSYLSLSNLFSAFILKYSHTNFRLTGFTWHLGCGVNRVLYNAAHFHEAVLYKIL